MLGLKFEKALKGSKLLIHRECCLEVFSLKTQFVEFLVSPNGFGVVEFNMTLDRFFYNLSCPLNVVCFLCSGLSVGG
jgi:hypothetical protein